jgi:hypothetical protein
MLPDCVHREYWRRTRQELRGLLLLSQRDRRYRIRVRPMRAGVSMSESRACAAIVASLGPSTPACGLGWPDSTTSKAGGKPCPCPGDDKAAGDARSEKLLHGACHGCRRLAGAEYEDAIEAREQVTLSAGDEDLILTPEEAAYGLDRVGCFQGGLEDGYGILARRGHVISV